MSDDDEIKDDEVDEEEDEPIEPNPDALLIDEEEGEDDMKQFGSDVAE